MTTDITPDDSVCPVYLQPTDPEQVKADQAELAKLAKVKADQATAKQAVITKLGLTSDEVTALLS